MEFESLEITENTAQKLTDAPDSEKAQKSLKAEYLRAERKQVVSSTLTRPKSRFFVGAFVLRNGFQTEIYKGMKRTYAFLMCTRTDRVMKIEKY